MSDTCHASAGLDPQGRRLLWRCRRGMKELDVLLERFALRHLASAGGGEREIFARFLELPDPLLADFLMGGARPAEAEFAHLVREITSSIIEPAS